MRKLWHLTLSWGPALVMMSIIFFFSSRTRNSLPNFGSLDFIVKKAGHVVGYALLGLAYWRGLGTQSRMSRYAWALAVIYAGTDEFHQSLVAGRNPSILDVLLFDNLGAALALWIGGRRIRRAEAGKPTRTPGRSPRLPPKSRDDQSEYR